MKKQYTLLLLVASFIANSQCFTKIFSGYNHVVATQNNNALHCWGWGDWGQQGNGSYFDEYVPITLSNSQDWQQFASGTFNTFVIKTNGSLWGTGNNTNGALGINSTVNGVTSLTQIGSSTNWRQVGAGGFFTVATKTDNTLWAWGINNSYQMGNTTCCANRLAPGQDRHILKN